VQLAPIGIEHDGSSLVRAGAALDTFCRGKQGMDFCHLCADLLAAHGGGEERDKSNFEIHLRGKLDWNNWEQH
jgi:hypothetical protein